MTKPRQSAAQRMANAILDNKNPGHADWIQLSRELLREDRQRRQMERAILKWYDTPGNYNPRLTRIGAQLARKLAQDRSR